MAEQVALSILMHPLFADRESARGAIKGYGKKRACSALAKTVGGAK